MRNVKYFLNEDEFNDNRTSLNDIEFWVAYANEDDKCFYSISSEESIDPNSAIITYKDRTQSIVDFSEYLNNGVLGSGTATITLTNNRQIQKIVLPANTTSIANKCFYSQYLNYNGLEEVVLPESCTSIGQEAFYMCTALKTINLENVETIGTKAFMSCSNLTSVEISGNTTVGSSAFKSCSKLSSVVINEGVTEISGDTFYMCTSLSSVSLPSTLTTIGMYAFYGCNNSELVLRVPSSVTTIGSSAFDEVVKVVYNGIATSATNWGAASLVTEE